MSASSIIVAVLTGMAVAGPALAQAGSDLCSQAPAVAGETTVAFDLSNAVADGLPHAGCDNRGDPQIWRDVWWVWTATCDGPARISTCGLTSVDTEIVVYSMGGPCPPTDNYIIACNDQSCGNQAETMFVAQAGQPYLVRLGRYSGSPGLTGSVRFECVGEEFCAGDYCQEGSNQFWAPSGSIGYRAADRWTPPLSGFITSLCVTGSQAGTFDDVPGVERIRITYYRDVNGRPGPAIAVFRPDALARLASETLAQGPYGPIYRSSFRHTPVAVEAGQPVWIEAFSENGTANWLWRGDAQGEGLLSDPSSSDGSWADATLFPGGLERCVGFERAPCMGDLDDDGAVNFADLNGLLSAFNAPCP